MPASNEDSTRDRAEELLVRYQDRLLGRIRWMMGDQARRTADSGDFLGEVMARILNDVRSLQWRDEAHFLALATRIARNVIVDSVRRPRVQRFESFTASMSAGQLPDAGVQTPSGAAARDEDVEKVLGALERLREDDRRVIELRHFEGLPFKTIGEQMGRAESAAQMLHARAVTRLGQLLAHG